MHDVPQFVTYLFAGLLVAMILCLALEEKIHAKKSVIVGGFAVITLLLAAAFGLVRPETVQILGHPVTLPVYIPGVDWAVIAIILGSSLFVDVTSKCGLFTWIAIKLTKASGGDPLRLLIYYGVMTVVFSAVLNNVTAMIIVGTLSAVSLGKLRINNKLLGFLLIEALLTNVGGLLTLISSVPNIIIGNAAGISFVDFFVTASPYVVVATAVTIFVGARVFAIKGLDSEQAKVEAAILVAGFDENDGIESESFFKFGTLMTGLFIVSMASVSVTPYVKELGMGYVALTFALIMLVRFKSTADRFYQALDWDLLAFFGCLFIVINMMEHALVLNLIGDGLKPIIALGEITGTGVLLFASAIASSVTDNIPLAAMLAKILGGMELTSDSPFWWAVIFGANLGGNITPIGSASTLVAVTIIHKNKLPMSFAGFVKVAVPFAAFQLILACAYVLLVLG
ncbi:MAG: SLC13 family permease [Rhodospirillales bacterium]|mgnify:FL=1|jgi:Na+/H+ antiporter NhaD/arsenite permease-like protein